MVNIVKRLFYILTGKLHTSTEIAHGDPELFGSDIGKGLYRGHVNLFNFKQLFSYLESDFNHLFILLEAERQLLNEAKSKLENKKLINKGRNGLEYLPANTARSVLECLDDLERIEEMISRQIEFLKSFNNKVEKVEAVKIIFSRLEREYRTLWENWVEFGDYKSHLTNLIYTLTYYNEDLDSLSKRIEVERKNITNNISHIIRLLSENDPFSPKYGFRMPPSLTHK